MTKKKEEQLKKEVEKLKKRLEELEKEKIKSEAIVAAIGDGIIIQDEENNRLLKAMASSTNGITIADENDRYIYVNAAYANMFGYSREDFIGETWRMVTPPEIIPLTEKGLEETLHNNNTGLFKGEVPGLRKDGRIIPTDVMATALYDEKGNYEGHVCIVNDITERKRMEQILRESEEKYRRLVETLMEGIWVLDKDANTSFVNPSMAQMLGYTIDEMLGKHLFSFTDEQGKEKATHYLERRHQGVKEQHDFEFIRKDGTRIYTSLETSPIIDENGNYSGAIAAIADITERKHTEEKLREGEQFLESIFASIQDGIGVIDTKMNIIRANKTAQEWYPHAGYFVGKKCYEAYHNRKERCEECPAQETLKTGKSSHKIVAKHGKSGKVIGWLEIYSYPLIDTKTLQMNGIIEYVRDITERKKVEKNLLESETRYRTLFESAGDAIFILEAEGKEEGRIVAANIAAARMDGYSRNELLAMNIKDLDTPESNKNSKNLIKRILKGETIKAELNHCRKDGTVFPVEISAGLMELGGHKYILAFDRDITERKRSEEALRLSNLVVENSQTVLFRWKAKEGWPVEFVSNNVVQFGYSAEDFLSGALLYTSIIHPDDIKRVSKEVLEHSGSGEDRFHQEYRIKAKNGATRWIDDRTVIERDRDGKITHYQGIIIDITERKHAEEAIQKYNLELEESNRMKELFTDIMHHDLLNPLNVAHGYVEIFLEDEKNPRKKSHLETIKRNLVKGMELIDNATKLSKLKDLKAIGFENLDLRNVVTEVIENLTPLAVNAGMSIENNLETSLPVRANKIIEDIFTNIIINAIKYAPQGKRIAVMGKEEANSCSVRIIDFGEGIGDTEKNLIFERFNRDEKKGVKGSGLGLAIAGRIVELHNGRIWVEDNPEGGAVFVVEIPKS